MDLKEKVETIKYNFDFPDCYFQINLRKVDPDEVRVSSVKTGTEGGITDVLQDALNNFRGAIAESSSEDESDEDSDEWDED